MDEAKDETWGEKTALRQSLHIISIHRSKKQKKYTNDSNDSNVPLVHTISQNVPKPETSHTNPDRVFRTNPFDVRSDEVVY